MIYYLEDTDFYTHDLTIHKNRLLVIVYDTKGEPVAKGDISLRTNAESELSQSAIPFQ